MDSPGVGTELCVQLPDNRPFHSQKCIICKKDSKLRLTTSENGQRKIIEAAEVRRDIVYERLLQNEGEFKYHMSNE